MNKSIDGTIYFHDNHNLFIISDIMQLYYHRNIYKRIKKIILMESIPSSICKIIMNDLFICRTTPYGFDNYKSEYNSMLVLYFNHVDNIGNVLDLIGNISSKSKYFSLIGYLDTYASCLQYFVPITIYNNIAELCLLNNINRMKTKWLKNMLDTILEIIIAKDIYVYVPSLSPDLLSYMKLFKGHIPIGYHYISILGSLLYNNHFIYFFKSKKNDNRSYDIYPLSNSLYHSQVLFFHFNRDNIYRKFPFNIIFRQLYYNRNLYLSFLKYELLLLHEGTRMIKYTKSKGVFSCINMNNTLVGNKWTYCSTSIFEARLGISFLHVNNSFISYQIREETFPLLKDYRTYIMQIEKCILRMIITKVGIYVLDVHPLFLLLCKYMSFFGYDMTYLFISRDMMIKYKKLKKIMTKFTFRIIEQFIYGNRIDDLFMKIYGYDKQEMNRMKYLIFNFYNCREIAIKRLGIKNNSNIRILSYNLLPWRYIKRQKKIGLILKINNIYNMVIDSVNNNSIYKQDIIN